MERGITWGVSWDKPAFGVFVPHDKAPATHGNGTMIALTASSKEQVRVCLCLIWDGRGGC